jgi:hypothetical protein
MLTKIASGALASAMLASADDQHPRGKTKWAQGLVLGRGNDDVERAACEQRVLPCSGMALAVVGEPDKRSRAVHQHLRQRRHCRTHDAQPQPSFQ